ncbi:MAG: sugar phosphate nucleotidyltransferase [Elusimicrobia bacterium]|nr:sugar phosphate nucleotidyltransferase [Elusimicrobiota bacterium]
MQAIILAGGKGSRLKPFTKVIPKPLVPIGDLPILEVVLRQLKTSGFKDVVITVNHLAELIMAFFGNGEKLGLNIDYSLEETPLGTAGPLSLIKEYDDNFLVMNGDLLTTLDYKKMMEWHKKEKNDITIACYNKKVKIDLGVIKRDGDNFTDYIEKPTYDFDVSMGIYIFDKEVMKIIKEAEILDMPDLVLRAKGIKKQIKCYIQDCIWLDIGRAEDYENAVQMFEEKKAEFLK